METGLLVLWVVPSLQWSLDRMVASSRRCEPTVMTNAQPPADARWSRGSRRPTMRLTVSRLLAVLRRGGAPRRLVDCERCGRDFVSPVAWHELDDDNWWIRVRCGECGSAREMVIDNEQAQQFDADLDRGAREIARSLSRLSREGSSSTTG